MGLMDAFNPEDRIEVTKSELYAQFKNTAKLDLMVELLANGVQADVINTAFRIKVKENKEA